jgi:glycosyltransferase involved in cell wall biosynthesis
MDHKVPRVSVLLPARDAVSTIGGALDSLRRQTHEEYELVLVDDGSMDGTVELARTALGTDARLRVVPSPGRGIVAALRAGLEACRGELVARMDADDLCDPRRLERQAAFLDDNPEIDIASCLVECFPAEELGEGWRRYERWLNGLVTHDQIEREIFVESPLAHPSVMFRAGPIRALGGYREVDWPEDYDLWLRASRARLRFGKVPEVLLRWRDHGARLSRRDPRYSEESFLRCKAHHLARGPLAERRAVVVWGAGPIGRRLARLLDGEGISIEAFVDIDPRKIGRRLAGAPVFPPLAIPELRARPILAAVGARGARDLIRERLVALGLREGDPAGFLCVS